MCLTNSVIALHCHTIAVTAPFRFIQKHGIPRKNVKFCLLFLRPKWGCHLNISVTPSDFRPLPHPFVLYAPWTGGSSFSLGLEQPWPCLDPFPLLALLFGIAFHLQLVLLSHHPILLRSYHFLKLVFSWS